MEFKETVQIANVELDNKIVGCGKDLERCRADFAANLEKSFTELDDVKFQIFLLIVTNIFACPLLQIFFPIGCAEPGHRGDRGQCAGDCEFPDQDQGYREQGEL